jgi:shikimate 5-dehydrogenase
LPIEHSRKAEELATVIADKHAQEKNPVRASSLQIHARPFDIVINGTSTSLGGEMLQLSPTILASWRLLLRHDVRQGAHPVPAMGESITAHK